MIDLIKGCTRLAAASDKVYQLLSHGRWFSPGTPTSSSTKTDRHDIAEILLKVTLNTITPNAWNCYREKIVLSIPYQLISPKDLDMLSTLMFFWMINYMEKFIKILVLMWQTMK
jgi:hypothetical protein